MSQQILGGPNFGTALQKMRGETVLQSMRRGHLATPGVFTALRIERCNAFFVSVVLDHPTCIPVPNIGGGGKHKLPCPFRGRIGVFLHQRGRHVYLAQTLFEISAMDGAHFFSGSLAKVLLPNGAGCIIE